MLLMTLFAVLFSLLRSVGADLETFAIISTMVAALALGQILLFGGRYPRAASIWVGGCLFPLQVIEAAEVKGETTKIAKSPASEKEK